MVLVGLVGKAADQRETAELRRRAGNRTPCRRTEEQGTETAEHRGCHGRIAAEHALGLLQQLVGRLAAGHLADNLGRLLLQPCLARGVLHALRRLAEHAADEAANSTRTTGLLNLLRQIAQHPAEPPGLACLLPGLIAGADQRVQE